QLVVTGTSGAYVIAAGASSVTIPDQADFADDPQSVKAYLEGLANIPTDLQVGSVGPGQFQITAPSDYTFLGLTLPPLSVTGTEAGLTGSGNTLTLTLATSGPTTISVGASFIAVPANASAATIQEAVGSLSSIGTNVLVTDMGHGNFHINALNGISLPQMLNVTSSGGSISVNGNSADLSLAPSGQTTIKDGTNPLIVTLSPSSTAADIAAALGTFPSIGVRATVTGSNRNFTIAPSTTLTSLPTLQVGEAAGGTFGPTPAAALPAGVLAGDRLSLPIPAFTISDG